MIKNPSFQRASFVFLALALSGGKTNLIPIVAVIRVKVVMYFKCAVKQDHMWLIVLSVKKKKIWKTCSLAQLLQHVRKKAQR